MQADQTIVANVALSTKKPTQLTFKQLETWVIWQFPRKNGGGLCGAIRPSLAKHGWYPAVIFPKEKRVQVYAHLDAQYDSPEAASECLN